MRIMKNLEVYVLKHGENLPKIDKEDGINYICFVPLSNVEDFYDQYYFINDAWVMVGTVANLLEGEDM